MNTPSRKAWGIFAISIAALISTVSAQTALTLPADNITLTDVNGRVITATVLSYDANGVNIRTNGKNTTIAWSKLNAATADKIKGSANAAPTTAVAAKAPGNVAGQRAIIILPFDQQERNGICASASVLNILKLLDPTLRLDQTEMFALFNSRRAGASPDQVVAGIKSVGFVGRLVPVAAFDPQGLLTDIKQSLDAGRPLLVGTRSHVTVLIGYDSTKGKDGVFYTWNQRMPKNKVAIEGLPDGTEEFTSAEFLKRILDVIFIELAPKPATCPPPTEELGKEGLEFTMHEIINANPEKESDVEFIGHAAAPAILAHIRRGSKVFIRDTIIADKNQDVMISKITEKGWYFDAVTKAGTGFFIPEKRVAELLAKTNNKFMVGAKPKPVEPPKPLTLE